MIVEIAGFTVGLAGLMLAGWSEARKRRVVNMYRQMCETRCKDLVETVRELDRSTSQACKIKAEHFDELMASQPKTIPALRQLSDQIHSIYVAENQLVRFCERLNDEHRAEFGSSIYADVVQDIRRHSDSAALLKESRAGDPPFRV